MNGTENGITSFNESVMLKNEDKNIKLKGLQFNTPFIYDDSLDTSSIENVLLIHDEIGNYKSLYDNSNTNTLAIVYSVRSNSDDLNTLLKSKFSSIKRLAIAFHDPSANQCKTFLNYAWLFTPDDLKEDIKEYSINMAFMINLIKNFNIVNIDFLGCNTLMYDNWNSYYNLLMNGSSVIVGASNDNTGNIKYGGDWIMESTHEDIKTIYFSDGIENYSGLLDASSIFETGIVYLKQNGNDIEWSTSTSGSWTTVGFPCILINNSWTQSSSILTVKQYSNLIIGSASDASNTNGYFQIGSQYITFDGNGYNITISGLTDYIGLINNGTSTSGTGYSNITLQNLIVNSSNGSNLVEGAGWIGQAFFGIGIDNTPGGIVNVITNNCTSSGDILGKQSGGIFGQAVGYNYGTVTATNCYSTGVILGESSGGIFGFTTGDNGSVSAENCYSTGDISGKDAGGIFGEAAGYNSGKANATNCYSTGEISGQEAGGIFGSFAGFSSGTATATNCYSTGDVIQTYSGGIFGGFAGYTNGIVNATNCYSTGIVVNLSGGIFGSIYGTANATNCTFNIRITGLGTLTSELYSIQYSAPIQNWNDYNANTALITNTNIWTDINLSTDIPYLLTSFNAPIYNPSQQSITNTGKYFSQSGLFISNSLLIFNYYIITINGSFSVPSSITIDLFTGVLTFNNVDVGTYVINILCSVLNKYVYTNYNINTYTLNVNSSRGSRGPRGLVGNKAKCNNLYAYLYNPSYIIFYNNLYTKLYNQLYNPIYNQSYNQSYNQLYNQLYNQIYDQLIEYGNTKNLGPRGPRGDQGPIGPECKENPVLVNNPTYELLYNQLYDQLYN
jgi:hypothetical protein